MRAVARPVVMPGQAGSVARRAASPLPFLAAGNKAVAGLLAVQRQGHIRPGGPSEPESERPARMTSGPPAASRRPRQGRIVFIMGTDRDGFYAAARRYWRSQGAEILGATSVANVFLQLRGRPQVFDEINIVCHASAEGGLSCKATDDDADRSTTYSELAELIRTSPALFELSGQVDGATSIRIRGCNIGRGRPMVEVLDEAFGGLASVAAPTHLETYWWHPTNTRATDQYLSGYFLEAPGVARKTRVELANELVAKYPPPAGMTDVRWRQYWLRNAGRLRRRVERPWVPIFRADVPSPDQRERLHRWAQQMLQRHMPGERVRRVEHFAYHLTTYVSLYIVTTRTADGATEVRTITIESPADDTALAQARTHHPRPEAARWEISYTQRRNEIVGRAYAVRTEWSQRFDMPRQLEIGTPATDDPRYYTVSTYEPGRDPRPSEAPQEQPGHQVEIVR